jgi:hypothetical protein
MPLLFLSIDAMVNQLTRAQIYNREDWIDRALAAFEG